MRKLNARERRLLVVLAIGGIALWFGLREAPSKLGRLDGETSASLADPGEPPVVRLELLGSTADAFDPHGRNLFAYYTPKRPVRPSVVSTRPTKPPRPPLPPKPVSPTSSIVQPALPQPAFDYIGLLGPKDDLIAVFSREAGIFVAQIGDVIDDTFELLDFRYEAVVLRYVGKEHGSGTVTLGRPSS